MTVQTSATRTAGTQSPNRLAGRLGPIAIVFMVVAAAAPLTVIAGTVPLGIAVGNGAAFPASYVVCTVVLLLFAVGFTAMARHIPGAGAFYTYITSGLGRHTGLGAAFLALLSYTAVQGARVRLHRSRDQRFRHRARRPVATVVPVGPGGDGRRRLARLPAHRTVRQGARRPAARARSASCW